MDQNRPIEKLLRRYAEKRRDEAGAPLELHPASRRLLQGEVSRQFPRIGAGGANALAGFFVALRRRWVYATALLGVGLIAAAMFLRQDNEPRLAATARGQDLAKNEFAPAAVTGKDAALKVREAEATRRPATSTPAAAPVAELALNQLSPTPPIPREDAARKSGEASALEFSGGTERRGLLDDGSAQIASSATRAENPGSRRFAEAPATTALTGAVGGERQLAEVARARSVPTGYNSDPSVGRDPGTTPPASAASRTLADASVAFESRTAPAPLARGGGVVRDRTSPVSQSFANLAPTEPQTLVRSAATPSSVLVNFQVEQSGDQLRVIDSDGSTYLGQLITTPGFGGGGGGTGEQLSRTASRFAEPPTTVVPAARWQSAQDYFYRVAGTNRTLNQQVVFIWNFVAMTNALADSKTKALGGSLNQGDLKSPQQFPALLQNSKINGRAQINAAKEIEINAVPVGP